MVRNRKTVQIAHKHGSTATSSSSASSDEVIGNRTLKVLSGWKTVIGFVCLTVAVYVGTLGYLETRVNTPFDDEKIVSDTGLAVPDRYWGTYRPGVYLGMKSREPRSPVFGLMWYDLASVAQKGIRHWCDQSDNLPSYGWLRHDGVMFGEQHILDPPHQIYTSFVKTPGGEHGGHWTVRVNVTAKDNKPSPFVLIWYGALDESLGPAAPLSRLWLEGGALHGYTPQLHNFRINLVPQKGKILHTSSSEGHAPGLHLLKEKFYSLLKAEPHPTFGRIAALGPDDEMHNKEAEVNFVPIQLVVETPFVLDVVYTVEDLHAPALKGDGYTRALEDRKRGFDEEFERKFGLKAKGYSEQDVSIAQAALANMLGGVGYFYGAGRVRSPHTREPVPYWRAPLYTAVPSRSFFPRGFLWDEGIHGLLLQRWSPEIQMDIAAHWLDLINVEGWIPREQILVRTLVICVPGTSVYDWPRNGAEALARVPKEFVVQSNAAANPPMLLITIAHLVRARPQLFQPHWPLRRTLYRMFTRLQVVGPCAWSARIATTILLANPAVKQQCLHCCVSAWRAWYQWFQSTQKGEEPTTYRWRGRDDDGLQLNPKTLTSGLDDYPRASHPSGIERHVDLRCWLYAAADAMAAIADVLQRDTSKFEATRDQLADEDLLNQLHWSPHTHTYADYGLHTDGVRLVRQPGRQAGEAARVVRSVTAPPSRGSSPPP
ncbi:hypothetical protein MSG28_014583 [Choristoneura fumiferana]|uniref:Uncharacterized protein n=1 Tax=Choristoneura fumiferana TaxID=7141 RepID=A0ACC0JS20_CHOFU|nr:hypothetical protein MSG28_014583 [Choristoneura fumiferana]